MQRYWISIVLSRKKMKLGPGNPFYDMPILEIHKKAYRFEGKIDLMHTELEIREKVVILQPSIGAS
jgi:hypothetical protein